MWSPKEFRTYAQACIRRAEEANDAELCQLLLALAKEFMVAAVLADRFIALTDDDTSRTPNGIPGQ